ncbi:transcriptional regulator, GntR family with UTRA sensor domain containing protein [Actinobacteria bacterium OK074]|nr:transcriptional regulator, GntR family with UTRA sensor domain containing protein [Actinobacteria bacterium OK074]
MPKEQANAWPYLQIAGDLRAAILSGERAPGSRIPGENELMESYGVARETARKALAVLRNEGLTETRKGAGTFVRAFRPIRRNATARLAAEQWGSGKSIWQADVDERPMRIVGARVDEVQPPLYIAQALGLADDGTAVRRSRRYVVEDKPVMLAISYLPADLVRDSAIAQVDTGSGGIYARLKELGHAPAHFREELRARMPDPSEVKVLDLGAGTPVITVVRTALDAEGRVVEVNEMTLDASKYLLEYNFTA